MNANQAYEFIVAVTGQISGSRQDHQKIVQALEVLKDVIDSKEVLESE